jgi:hypothetical protein
MLQGVQRRSQELYTSDLILQKTNMRRENQPYYLLNQKVILVLSCLYQSILSQSFLWISAANARVTYLFCILRID